MKLSSRTLTLGLVAALLAALLAGCSPAPLYKTQGNAPAITPAQVSQAPEQYQGTPVIWGGTVVHVSNFADRSEIEILSYPLDRSQRPNIGSKNGNGRFLAVLPGFVEPLNFPPGSPITVMGDIDGTHAGKVGDAPYVFARVKVRQHHVWSADEMRRGHPHVSFGVGVGSGGGFGLGVGVH